MLQGEHSAILLTCITLPFVIKIFVLSIFEWPLKTGFTVSLNVFSIAECVQYVKLCSVNHYVFKIIMLYFTAFCCSSPFSSFLAQA